MEKKTQINSWYLLLAVFGIMLLQSFWVQWQTVEVVPYSKFLKLLKDGKVAEIVVTEEQIQGILKEPLPDGRTQFSARRVEPDLARDLSAYDVNSSTPAGCGGSSGLTPANRVSSAPASSSFLARS